VFDAEIIELCVRWYITYRLSYCDLELEGEPATIDLVMGYNKSNTSSLLKRFLVRATPQFVQLPHRDLLTLSRTAKSCADIFTRGQLMLRM
jgi:hypothetical protein